MSSIKKKEITVQETFYNLCKDLIRYIDRKIVKKYISPNQAQVPKEKRIKEKKYNDNRWRYFYEDEDTTNEDRIRDIFKDNRFLMNLQELNKILTKIVNNMEENKKNNEELKKKLEMEEQQLKLFGDINTQLTKYFLENNSNINNINQNDLIKAFDNLQNENLFKNLNQEMIQQFINNANYNIFQNNINMQQNSSNNIINNNLNINNDINNNINNNTNNINNNINNNENNIQLQNKNKLYKNKSIPTLIQALESINKSKNNKINNQNKKIINKNKILDSDSEDSDEEEENEEEEEEEEKEEENKNNQFEKIKNKKGEIIDILNRKTKRKKGNL